MSKVHDEARRLAQAALATAGAAEPLVAADETDLHLDPTADDAAAEAQAAYLIELYFRTEAPLERELVFEKLAASRLPLVEEFLLAMMREDEDPLLAAAAAAVLAHREHPEALAHLEDQLAQDDDLEAFAHAVQTLVPLRGEALYAPLQAIWRDLSRDGSCRREALLGMETLDPQATLQELLRAVQNIPDVTQVLLADLEATLACFARQGFTAALPTLERLQARCAAAAFADGRDQRELLGMLQEGMALLRLAPA